jgi:hypothetical protein
VPFCIVCCHSEPPSAGKDDPAWGAVNPPFLKKEMKMWCERRQTQKTPRKGSVVVFGMEKNEFNGIINECDDKKSFV